MQSVNDVMAALKFLESHDISRYNIASIATAKLGTVVVGALGGKKTSVSAEDFLPFDTRKIKGEVEVSEDSLQVLRKLMKSRPLDPRLIATLVAEIKMASNHEDD
ncbi:MAG: hypothetical protein CML73_05740 [Rhodobiaceae bacterium]|nr:hypothetical protein [Rhodobiaceae bacterium]